MAPAPPRFTTVGREEFLRRAEARSLRISRQLQSVVRQTWTSPELLHDLHRQLRRARLDLRVLRRGAKKVRREAYEEADRALRELAELTGAARDRDVSGTLLRSVVASARRDAKTRHRLEKLLELLASEGRWARRELRKEAVRWLQRGRPRLPVVVEDPSSVEEKRFARAARTEILRRDRELRRAIVRAHRRPTSLRLHALRIALRRTRNLRAALAHPTSTEEFPDVWRRLQKELGDHHDLAVLEAWVARQRSMKGTRALRAELRQAIRRRERAAERRLLKAMDELGGELPHAPLR